MVRERPDLVRWTSTDRFVGHEPVPDELSLCVRAGSRPPECTRGCPGSARGPRQDRKEPAMTRKIFLVAASATLSLVFSCVSLFAHGGGGGGGVPRWRRRWWRSAVAASAAAVSAGGTAAADFAAATAAAWAATAAMAAMAATVAWPGRRPSARPGIMEEPTAVGFPMVPAPGSYTTGRGGDDQLRRGREWRAEVRPAAWRAAASQGAK